MIWRRVYDPGESPAHWSEAIRPGEYAVFLFDARTHVARDDTGRYPERGETSVALCGDLKEANEVAGRVVEAHPELCCEIYDHEGMAREPVEVIYNPAERGRYVGRPAARREAIWGAALCLCAVPFIAADFRAGLGLIWGYVIGLKLLIVGFILLVRGFLGLHEYKS